MKKFRFSLLFIVLLLATSPFHLQIERFIIGLKSFRFVNYVLLGLLAAFFVVALIRSIINKKVIEMAAVMLAAAVIFYFIFPRHVFMHNAYFSIFLHIAEFFILGFIIFKENRNAPSPVPFLLLLIAAAGLEVIQRWLPHRVFDWQDIWLNGISGLAGFIVALF
jgi:hypothetical protein